MGLIGLPAILMASLSRRDRLIEKIASKLGPLGQHKLLEYRIIDLKTLLTIDFRGENV